MRQFKKILSFMYSMKLAVILLALIVLACVAGSVISQNQVAVYYEAYYGAAMAKLISTMQLDQVFTCWWFLLLVAVLCVNLLLCSVLRFKTVFKRCRQYPDMRHRVSVWGPWLCHVGMLLLIVGFALGQVYSFEAYVYGVPGQTKQVEGKDYSIRIDDFQILLREDDTVEQYVAELTVIDNTEGTEVSGTAMVNHPMDAFGMRVYQNSTGWACQVDVYRDEQLEGSCLMCVGEALMPASMPELALVFDKLYPDYAETENGALSLSSQLNNPCVAFSIYYQERWYTSNVVGVDHDLIASPFRFVFHDPQPYTLIQVIHDPYMGLTGVGGVIILVSLFICFYVRPEDMRKHYMKNKNTEEEETAG